MIRVIICGDRHWTDQRKIAKVIRRLIERYGRERLLIITGGQRGADTIAARVARDHGVHVAEIEALWDDYGPAAGPVRNSVMLSLKPHAVIAFHPDLTYSKGTADCVRKARKAIIRVVHVK